MKKNQQILTGLILFVILVGVGTASIILLSETSTTPETGENTQLNGFETTELTPGSIEVEDLRAFSVTFKELTEGQILVTLESGEELRVSLNSETQVIRRTAIAPEEFEEQYQEYLTEVENQPEPTEGEFPDPITPPSPFIEEEIDIETLESGDQLLLQTIENARETKNLTAQTIVIQEISQVEPAELNTDPLPELPEFTGQE